MLAPLSTPTVALWSMRKQRLLSIALPLNSNTNFGYYPNHQQTSRK